MKNYISDAFKALFMSMGMFSVFPVPKNSWNDKYMPLIIPCMPAVGAIIGRVWYELAVLLGKANVPVVMQSSIILLIPFVLSGFLHIDGYMDTSDAIFSRRSMEEKRRILKDSHIGAFAVIAVLCLFLIQFSAVYTIISQSKSLLPLVFIPVMSRAAAGIAVLNLKPISDTGFVAAFKANTKPVHTIIIFVIIATMLITAYRFYGVQPLIPISITVITAICTTSYVYKQLQGISGDLSGCIITVSEAVGLISIALL